MQILLNLWKKTKLGEYPVNAKLFSLANQNAQFVIDDEPELF